MERSDGAGSPDSFYSDKWTPNPLRPYSDIQKLRNQALVKQLLKEFDMEETIKRYTAQNSQEFVLDENEYSVDSSLSTLRTRQTLQRLMGTDVIRLNDRHYTEKLLQKLQEEYEANEDKKEKALEEAEKQRLRKLMLDGIISPSTYRNPDGKHPHTKKRKHKHGPTENDKVHKKNVHPSIMHDDSPYYRQAEERRDSQVSSGKSGEHRQKEEDVETQMEYMDKKYSKENIKEDPEEPNGEENGVMEDESKDEGTPRKKANKKQVQWSTPTKYSGYPKTNQPQYRKTPSPKREIPKGRFSRREGSLVHELRCEETVDGLYKLAEKIVLS